MRRDKLEARSQPEVVAGYCKEDEYRIAMDETYKVVEIEGVTILEDRMVKPNSSPNYIDLELKYKEAILIDP